ncbi:Panacea domain-containing protein [Saccharophagus degradans]|uniref:Uncharacterized phage-associated protein-like protein n=1 Tax=Saccharophagus degradans (strain 2-40 / ATCC 43961 / DSM 17024) TaxID=203122 RepID=Q21H54_SACD2|nr:type II toxin-antitoxin system antitoxin SocA domain-containing protein [Saccharophagus degradans]ABD81975.1 Uncharacterized phage-associated protein-like protein [Saccharophagus degradans 2-40]
MSSHSAIDVAYKFLQKAASEGGSLTPMQLQKLVYIAHGCSLGWCDAPLIKDDVYAWKFGPVIEDLYHCFKRFRADEVQVTDKQIEAMVEAAGFSDAEDEIIDAVWNNYKHYSGPQLSDLTHQPGTPWYQTWRHGDSSYAGAVIDNRTIAEHYKHMLAGA